MGPADPSRPPEPATTRPRPVAAPPPPSAGDAEWDELTLASFGPRYWNLGCG